MDIINSKCDHIFNKQLIINQPESGYRFSVDALLLSWFASNIKNINNCADLGCGSGIVGLSLLQKGIAKTLTGIEIQKTLFDFSVLNSKVNNLNDRCSFFNFDIKDSQVHILKEKSFELVVSNPPFWAKNMGRLSADDQRRIARHEIEGTLSDFARVAHRIMHPVKGRFCIAFPASRMNYLVDTLNRNSLYLSRIIPVYPLRDKSAELLLVESKCKQAPSTVFESPLYLKDENNKDSEILEKIVSGEY